MEQLLDPEFWIKMFNQSLEWIQANVLTWENLIQIAVGVVLLPLSLYAGRKIKKGIRENIENPIPAHFKIRQVFDELVEVVPYLFLAFIFWAASVVLRQFEAGFAVLNIAQTLIIAWVCIRLAAAVILDRFLAKVITLVALAVAVFHITGLWQPIMGLLEGIGFTLGGVHLTILSVVKAIVVIFILLRFGNWVADQFEHRIRGMESLTPSAHVLISKTIKISVVGLVVVIGLTSIGIDLSAFAVFSGAIGVGIGFGLQKVVANFISGIILLVDKSIKPGDVIEIGDVYGWVSDFKGRYASVVTRDGKEFLIPNEDMITQQVINWSYSFSKIRVKIPVGISYNDDVHQARQLMLDSVEGIDRVLSDPKPACLLKGFGDNSVDLELRFWIQDPQNGLANIRSIVMLKIWDLFKANDIEIPFPQRDVHLDTQTPINIRTINASDLDNA